MSKKLMALVAAGTLAVAGIANAAATATVTAYPSSQLPAAYSANYTAYLVTFVPTAGDKLVGFVISPAAGGVAGTGVSGTLLQRFTSDGDAYQPTPFVGTGPSAAASSTSVDTRAINVVTNPGPINATENLTTYITTNDPASTTSATGTGTQLQGIYGFAATTPINQSIPALYIVTPNNTPATIAVQVATAAGVSNLNFTTAVPEPMSAGLASLALLGLAKRRRA